MSNQNNFHRSDRCQGVFFHSNTNIGLAIRHICNIHTSTASAIFRCLIYAVSTSRHLHSVDYKMPISSHASLCCILYTYKYIWVANMSPLFKKCWRKTLFDRRKLLLLPCCGCCVALASCVAAFAFAVCYGKFNQPRVQGRSNATNELPHTQPASQEATDGAETMRPKPNPNRHLEKY